MRNKIKRLLVSSSKHITEEQLGTLTPISFPLAVISIYMFWVTHKVLLLCCGFVCLIIFIFLLGIYKYGSEEKGIKP